MSAEMTDNPTCDQDQQITSIADAVVKLKELRESNKNLNEPDIEEKFARLSLAFKTDKITLCKRLDLQLRQRDIAEKNIEGELKALRESLNALNQLCTESDMRDIITKTQQHVDIVQQATMRMSSRAETYGAIQQEQRMNCAFETMLNYVEHLKLLYDKEHLELEEYRRLLAEHNLLPDEKASMEDDLKRMLPPRSQSLSSSSKPEFFRRGSVGTCVRAALPNIDKVNKDVNSSYNGWNLSIVRQKLESRTRLLSAVCLLNNNYDSSRTTSNGNSGSLSPKSRRASLPVGPLAQSNTSAQISSSRVHGSISEKQVMVIPEKRKLSRECKLTRTESEDSNSSKPEADNPRPLEGPTEEVMEENTPNDDSSDLTLSPTLSSNPDQDSPSTLACSLQEPNCDNGMEGNNCLIPDLIVPVISKPLYVMNLIQKVSVYRAWRWDSTTIILHARYTLSAILATAAMLTLVLTFIPNHIMAHVLNT